VAIVAKAFSRAGPTEPNRLLCSPLKVDWTLYPDLCCRNVQKHKSRSRFSKDEFGSASTILSIINPVAPLESLIILIRSPEDGSLPLDLSRRYFYLILFRMIIYNPPTFPTTTSVSRDVTLLDVWDSDTILKLQLKRLEEPTSQIDREHVIARIKLSKLRIRDLSILRANLGRASPTVDRELATELFRCKLMTWAALTINNFPTEIITQIFRMVVGSMESAVLKTRARESLSWVSKRFRNIAVMDPFLWCHIAFIDSARWSQSLLALERAQSVPLEITYRHLPRQDGAGHEVTTAQVHWLLGQVLRKVTNLKKASFFVEDVTSALVVLDNLRTHGPASSLTSFELHCREICRETDPHFVMPLCNGHLPKLRDLALSGMAIDWYKLPFNNLRSIHLRSIDWNLAPSEPVFRQMLSSPQLYSLRIADSPVLVAMAPEGVASIPPVKLPNLREVAVAHMTAWSTVCVFALLDAPGIRTLRIADMPGDDVQLLFDYITGQFPELRMLTLYNVKVVKTDLNMGTMVRFMDATPKLEMLHVHCVPPWLLEVFEEEYNDHRYVEADTRVRISPHPEELNETNYVCPQLRFLQFGDLDGTSVYRLVKERHDLGLPFTRVYTSYDTAMQMTKADRDKMCLLTNLVMMDIDKNPDAQRILAEMRASVPLFPDE